MRVHVFQHAPFEDLGSIRGWLNDRGAQVRYTRLFAGDPLPVLEEIDMLIAMGGPMSVNDEADHPWLTGEKQAVREAIAMDMPVLGVCLGAQLIASALGARVYRNAVKEIGWFPIQGVQGVESAFAFPSWGTMAFAQSSNPLIEGCGRLPHPDPTSDSFDTTCPAFATSGSRMTRVDRN